MLPTTTISTKVVDLGQHPILIRSDQFEPPQPPAPSRVVWCSGRQSPVNLEPVQGFSSFLLFFFFCRGRHAVAGVPRAYPSAPGPIWDPLRRSRGTWPSTSCPRVACTSDLTRSHHPCSPRMHACAHAPTCSHTDTRKRTHTARNARRPHNFPAVLPGGGDDTVRGCLRPVRHDFSTESRRNFCRVYRSQNPER